VDQLQISVVEHQDEGGDEDSERDRAIVEGPLGGGIPALRMSKGLITNYPSLAQEMAKTPKDQKPTNFSEWMQEMVAAGKQFDKNMKHRQTGFSLEPGARGFFDSESNLPRLKNTHVADCKPQAPLGRRWDFALELGLGLFLQNIREPPGRLRS
jgi:hypothetical protein